MLHPDIESLDYPAICRLQKERLAKLGQRLSERPDWVAHFAAAGMKLSDLAAEDGLAHAPFLDKSALHSRYPFPFLAAPMQSVRRFMATSGTTGLPVLFGMTEHDYGELLPYQMARILTAAGVQRGQRAYQGYGYGLWIGGPALDVGFAALDCATFPIGPGRGELVVKWLRDHSYDVASMSPLWLMSLVTIARQMGIDPKTEWTIRLAILGGQSVSAEFRKQLEAEMPDGFVSQNIYGTTEAGGPVLAISTPYTHDDDELQLVNEDTIITEILDPVTLKPVSPGEVGEIVITTLCREASPVVRWRTRDLVRLSPSPFDCRSGRRGMRKIGRIIGRSDDMLKVKGVIVFPSQIEDIIAATKGTVKEAWQIYVDKERTTIGTMCVAVEAERSSDRPTEQIVSDVKREMRARLGMSVEVECLQEGTLPRYEAKATRVLIVPSAPEMKARSFKYILNVEDMRLEAPRRLPRAIFDFVDGAAEDEVSRRRNRAQFDEWGFVQRVLNDVGAIDLSISLFGRRYAAPFGIGPTGLAGLAWPKAESLLARAAAAAGIPFCLSTVSSVRLEEVAETSGAGNWFQLYIFRNRDLSRSLLERARAAGYAVLVITVDCATGGNRERDPRNDFTLPLRLTRRNLADTALHPGWLMRMARTGAPKPANMVEAVAGSATSAQGLVAFMNAQLDPSVTWRDVQEFIALWNGPVIVKGVLSVRDAVHAAELGAAGVVLSNHGGRQLDGAVSPLTVLPEIRHAVGNKVTILCDSGFRRGTDIIKARALGADAVLMGRNTLYGAGAAGAPGIAHVISILRTELERAMTLLGTARIVDISREHVRYVGPVPHESARNSCRAQSTTDMGVIDTPRP